MADIESTAKPVVDIIPITRLHKYLDDNEELYDDCEVFSITHSKNGASKVLHEYLHIIIRNQTTGAWRRILAERQSNQDQVIIGLWPWVYDTITVWGGSSSSGKGGEPKLPLLLRNIRTALSMWVVADVLLEVHNRAERYDPLGENCFWYADGAFRALMLAGPEEVKYTTWNWLKYRAWVWVPNPFTRIRMHAAAKEFLRELVVLPIKGDLPTFESTEGAEGVQDLHPPPISDGPDLPSSLTPDVDDDEVSDAIVKAMEKLDLPSNLEETATVEAVRERRADIVGFTTAVFKDPLAAANLEFARERLGKVHDSAPSDPENSFIERLVKAVGAIAGNAGPTEEEEARYEDALMAFAGDVAQSLPRRRAATAGAHK